jgi:hypothetical protein
MTSLTEGPDHIGDPDALLSDERVDHDGKIARLKAWRDALKSAAQDDTATLGSGEADRLIAIERALHALGADGA